MSKKQFLLPFGVFAVIACVLAVIDYIFINATSPSTLIWRYPSDVSSIAGALWFGEVGAALITPFVLRYRFNIRQLTPLLPWIFLAGLVMGNLIVGMFSFVNTPYESTEILWRGLHTPMTSLQTMTFSKDADYVFRLMALQIPLALTLAVGYVVSSSLSKKRRRRQKANNTTQD